MRNNQSKNTFDPVLLMAVGVGLIVVALILIAFGPPEIEFVPATIFAGPWGQIGVAFLTGLTTGGLSCLAVQGGLLASSLARQIEVDLLNQSPQRARKGRQDQKTRPALPIALFLLSKLVVYTILGALLGWLGSFLSLDPLTRSLLLIMIGIFMIGNGLRTLDIHPLFRYFSIAPPKVITQFIRRTSKNGTELAVPVFLGALTVLIPCGITQAMMGAALATGRAGMGAALMFAFTLGTTPVFFLVAYLTTQIGARLESFFMRFVAIALLVLGLVSLNSGLNLIGSPLSFENITRSLVRSTNAAAPPEEDGNLVLYVRNQGYFPQTLRAKASTPTALRLITEQTYSCARDFVIPALGYYQLLPDSGTVVVDIPAQPAGARLFFTCSMGMYTGLIVFE